MELKTTSDVMAGVIAGRKIIGTLSNNLARAKSRFDHGTGMAPCEYVCTEKQT